VDFVRAWADKTEIAVGRFLSWVGIGTSKFHDWKARFGKVNEHNTWVPRDHWLTDAEKQGIRSFARGHPLEGYRRLTFMMLDADVVACSPVSVYRVLKTAGLLARQTPMPTKKGTGFVQPLRPHEHWHVDVSYLNIAGTFYFLCSILDGCSRFIVHWEIREKMEENDVETIIQRACEAYPDARPRIISDNGQGLQGVHPHLRHDPCQNLALLPPKQRQDRTLAQDPQRRLHPRAHAAVAG
jgi:putative transposase